MRLSLLLFLLNISGAAAFFFAPPSPAPTPVPTWYITKLKGDAGSYYNSINSTRIWEQLHEKYSSLGRTYSTYKGAASRYYNSFNSTQAWQSVKSKAGLWRSGSKNVSGNRTVSNNRTASIVEFELLRRRVAKAVCEDQGHERSQCEQLGCCVFRGAEDIAPACRSAFSRDLGGWRSSVCDAQAMESVAFKRPAVLALVLSGNGSNGNHSETIFRYFTFNDQDANSSNFTQWKAFVAKISAPTDSGASDISEGFLSKAKHLFRILLVACGVCLLLALIPDSPGTLRHKLQELEPVQEVMWQWQQLPSLGEVGSRVGGVVSGLHARMTGSFSGDGGDGGSGAASDEWGNMEMGGDDFYPYAEQSLLVGGDTSFRPVIDTSGL